MSALQQHWSAGSSTSTMPTVSLWMKACSLPKLYMLQCYFSLFIGFLFGQYNIQWEVQWTLAQTMGTPPREEFPPNVSFLNFLKKLWMSNFLLSLSCTLSPCFWLFSSGPPTCMYLVEDKGPSTTYKPKGGTWWTWQVIWCWSPW